MLHTSGSCRVVDGKISWRGAEGRRWKAGAGALDGGSGRSDSDAASVAVGTDGGTRELGVVADALSGALSVFVHPVRGAGRDASDAVHARVRRRALPTMHHARNLCTQMGFLLQL